jgi:hypothetical protein
MVLMPFAFLFYLCSPHEPWDMTTVRQYTDGIDLVSTGSRRVVGYCSPDPLPAHSRRLLSLRPNSRSLWNLPDVEITKRCLRDIVDKEFNETSKERSQNAKTIPALHIPKPAIQPRARLHYCEQQSRWKSPVLVANL